MLRSPRQNPSSLFSSSFIFRRLHHPTILALVSCVDTVLIYICGVAFRACFLPQFSLLSPSVSVANCCTSYHRRHQKQASLQPANLTGIFAISPAPQISPHHSGLSARTGAPFTGNIPLPLPLHILPPAPTTLIAAACPQSRPPASPVLPLPPPTSPFPAPLLSSSFLLRFCKPYTPSWSYLPPLSICFPAPLSKSQLFPALVRVFPLLLAAFRSHLIH